MQVWFIRVNAQTAHDCILKTQIQQLNIQKCYIDGMFQIDHIFIFSSCEGKEADELVQFGLTEGSSRIHPGQGTMNRKFYFENFFLEILWVYNQAETQSEQTIATKLWERSNFQTNNYSPFGLCLALVRSLA